MSFDLTSTETYTQKTIDDYFPKINTPISKSSPSKPPRFLLELPQEMLSRILGYSNPQSVLKLELTGKKCLQLTKLLGIWKLKKIEHLCNFEWKMTQNESDPDKSDFYINQSLCDYILHDRNSYNPNPDFELAQSIYAKYGELINRFPILGNYIGAQVNLKVGINLPIKEEIMQQFNKTLLEGKYGGELLLHGLIATKEKEQIGIPIALQSFLLAVQKQATIASLASVKIFFKHNDNTEFQKVQLLLAAEAADRHDPRALSILLEKYKVSALDAATNSRILGHSWKEANTLMTHALAAHGKNPPTQVLFNAARIKLELGMWKESDRLFTQAFAESDLNPSAEINNIGFVKADKLQEAAFVKFKLDELQEADRLFNLAIAAYGEHVPRDLLLNGAEIKSKLQLWKESDRLYTLAIAKNAGPHVLHGAPFVKLELGELQEADNLFTLVIGDGLNAPADLLISAALLKEKLGLWKEAERLCTLAIAASSENLPPKLLDSVRDCADRVKIILLSQTSTACDVPEANAVSEVFGTTNATVIPEKFFDLK